MCRFTVKYYSGLFIVDISRYVPFFTTKNIYFELIRILSVVCIRFWPKPDLGVCTLNEGIFFLVFLNEYFG